MIVEEIVFELVRTLYLRSSTEVTTTTVWWRISLGILHYKTVIGIRSRYIVHRDVRVLGDE